MTPSMSVLEVNRVLKDNEGDEGVGVGEFKKYLDRKCVEGADLCKFGECG